MFRMDKKISPKIDYSLLAILYCIGHNNNDRITLPKLLDILE